MKVQCPKCNSEDYELAEDLTGHMAYDTIVDSIASDRHNFCIELECSKCGCHYLVVFDIINIERVPIEENKGKRTRIED